MIRSSALVAAVALAAVLPPGTARGDDRAAARRSFAQGERAFAREEFEQALAAYEAAYAAAPLPAFHFNIAQCHRKLGHWEQARDAFQLFLDSGPEGEARTVAEELLREVTLEIPPPEPAPAHEPEPPAPRARRAAPEPHDRVTSPGEGGGVRWPTWTVLGAGVVLAGVATVFAIDLASAQSDFDDPSLDCGHELDRCVELRDRGQSSATLRTVFAAGALAALVTGAVLLTLDLSRSTEVETSRLAIAPSGARLELAW